MQYSHDRTASLSTPAKLARSLGGKARAIIGHARDAAELVCLVDAPNRGAQVGAMSTMAQQLAAC